MKSRLLFAFSILFLASIFISCNKDKNPPDISILGSNPIYNCLGIEYVDPGATALDEEDGDITDKINSSINVDIDQIGNYTVVYTVEDKAGNSAIATRMVNVIYCK